MKDDSGDERVAEVIAQPGKMARRFCRGSRARLDLDADHRPASNLGDDVWFDGLDGPSKSSSSSRSALADVINTSRQAAMEDGPDGPSKPR